jgi:hypothetical protein
MLKNKTLIMKQSVLTLICLLSIQYVVLAQIPVNPAQSMYFSPADSQKLFFSFHNKNFFKNNEYFNPLNEGYTLLGFVAQPSLSYLPGKTTKIEVGGSFLKYSGRQGFSDIQPILRFQYQPSQSFQMVMGSIFGGVSHGLIEPLYRWEQDFMNPLESGLQFLFNTSHLKTDVWLQWEKFIFRNDPFQEQLTVGTTFSWNLNPDTKNFNLSIPFQSIINHHGGQEIAIDTAIQTLANYATGIKASWQMPRKLKELTIECWVMRYNDLSPQKLQAYKNGYGIYPKAGIKLGSFMFQTGYFYGEKFIAIKGEPLFHSALTPNSGILFPIRNLLSAKFAFIKRVDKGISMAAYTETYTDLKSGNTDYNYGVHIIFDQEFFITKIK